MNCVIIPTLNEGKTIEKVIENIPKGLDIYVIDGLSTDDTIEIAKRKGAKIILEKNKGKGNAFRKALNVLRKDYDKIVMLDGDYTYNPGDIPKFIKKLDVCDIVFGKRILKKESMSVSHRFGNFILTMVAKILYGNKISDLCTGYIGFGKRALNKIEISASGFDLEANIFTQAVKKRLVISEIPIKYSPAVTTSKLNSFSDGIKIIRMLVKQRFS